MQASPAARTQQHEGAWLTSGIASASNTTITSGVSIPSSHALNLPPRNGDFLSTSPLSPGASSDVSNEAVNSHSFNAAAGLDSYTAARLAEKEQPLIPASTRMAAATDGRMSSEAHRRTAGANSASTLELQQGTPGASRPSLSSYATSDSVATASPGAGHNHGPGGHYGSTTTMGSTSGGGNGSSGVSASTPATTLTGLPMSAASLSQTSAKGANGSGGSGLGIAADDSGMIPTSFDEGTLRTLCEMDCALPLLYDRIKQSMVSCTAFAAFLKKRATLEEEYGRSLMKASRGTSEAYSTGEGKAGTFVTAFQSIMRTHEQLAESRIRFAAKLSEMSDELTNLAKEVDRNRKNARETGSRLERNLQDAEASAEKARSRFDSTAEDLERLLLVKSGESAKGGELQGTASGGGAAGAGKRTLGKAMGKTGLLFKNKNPQQMLKQEEEIRARTSTASDAFRKEMLNTQGMRQEYFNLQLPRILRSLKESAEEIDNGLQYHMTRYAFLYESTVLADGMAISPVPASETTGGLKTAAEAIDNRSDFKTFMQNYQVAHGRDYKGPRRDGPYEEGFVPPPSSSFSPSASGQGLTRTMTGGNSRAIFGVHLAEQMARDNVEVPPILEKCAEAIEAVGLESMGIYRLSGTTSRVQKLKAKFDADSMSVDLLNDEAMTDINIIAGCLKLWFRELPEPLMTWEGYAGFIEAAKIPNDRLRHIRIHERVNDLPDCNYATLRALMAHLDRVRQHEDVNQMSASNLAIVFGPTLLGPPPANAASGVQAADGSAGATGGVHLADMGFQCKAIETILMRYREIFVDEEEEEGAPANGNQQGGTA